MQGWQETSGSPPCKASPPGGGCCLKAGCPGSFPPPPWLSCSGKERIHLGEANAQDSLGKLELPRKVQLSLLPGILGACICPCALAGLGASCWTRVLSRCHQWQMEEKEPVQGDEVPVVSHELPCHPAHGTPSMTQPGTFLVAPSCHPVTAHSSHQSFLGFPWHQSLWLPQPGELRVSPNQGCPCPHLQIVSVSSTWDTQAGAEVENCLGRREPEPGEEWNCCGCG